MNLATRLLTLAILATLATAATAQPDESSTYKKMRVLQDQLYRATTPYYKSDNGSAVAAAATDSAALVALYTATGGAQWDKSTNWLTGPVGSWHGVNVRNGRVKELFLDRNNLSGELPAELANLTELKWLELDDNNLTGSIPPEIGEMDSLRVLSVQSNQLSGPLPSELANASTLSSFWLAHNQLTGEIPVEIASKPNLVFLALAYNQLEGPLPAELGSGQDLLWIWLNGNMISGPIPPELGNARSLVSIDMNDNLLTGPVSAELVDPPYMESIRLSGNRLSGRVPLEFLQVAGLWSHESDCSLAGEGGSNDLCIADTPETRALGNPICGITLSEECADVSQVTSAENDRQISDEVGEIFPNPATGLAFLPISRSGSFQLETFDILGRLVSSTITATDGESGGIDLDLSGHPAGVYFVRIDGATTRRVVVR